jgi:hypothetical protein
MKLTDAGYDAKLQQLVKDTQHHVKEEETSVCKTAADSAAATKQLPMLSTHLL